MMLLEIDEAGTVKEINTTLDNETCIDISLQTSLPWRKLILVLSACGMK